MVYELGQTDMDSIMKEINELNLGEDDMPDLGFSDNVMNEILESINIGSDLESDDETADDIETMQEHDDDEDIVDEHVEYVVKHGDIWQLGDHRLMCGNSVSSDDVKLLMNNNYAELLFTSPPYADMRTYNDNKNLDVEYLSKFIPTYYDYVQYQAINLGIKRENFNIVSYWDEYIKQAKNSGYLFLSWNVWAKQNACSIGNQSAFIPISHEWIFVFGKQFKNINRTIERKTPVNNKRKTSTTRKADGSMVVVKKGKQEHLKAMESVLYCPSELGAIRKKYPATFPIELPTEYILAITDYNDIVVDPFGGSGTTMIACEKIGRKCYMMEYDTKYCSVIIKRWEELTGLEAVKVEG